MLRGWCVVVGMVLEVNGRCTKGLGTDEGVISLQKASYKGFIGQR